MHYADEHTTEAERYLEKSKDWVGTYLNTGDNEHLLLANTYGQIASVHATMAQMKHDDVREPEFDGYEIDAKYGGGRVWGEIR